MATEYQLLFDLSVNAGLVLTHDQLLLRVLGFREEGRPAGAAPKPEAAPPQARRGR